MQSKSFQDVIDQVNYLNMIAKQDKSVASEVGNARIRVRAQRVKAQKAKVSVASEARVIAYRAVNRTITLRALRGDIDDDGESHAHHRRQDRGAREDRHPHVAPIGRAY